MSDKWNEPEVWGDSKVFPMNKPGVLIEIKPGPFVPGVLVAASTNPTTLGCLPDLSPEELAEVHRRGMLEEWASMPAEYIRRQLQPKMVSMDEFVEIICQTPEFYEPQPLIVDKSK